MTIIPKEELDQYDFSLLPNNVYLEMVKFAVTATGRVAKVLLAVPTKDCTTGKLPAYVIIIKMDTRWIICPWISDEILAVLNTLVAPSSAKERVPEEIKPLLAS